MENLAVALHSMVFRCAAWCFLAQHGAPPPVGWRSGVPLAVTSTPSARDGGSPSTGPAARSSGGGSSATSGVVVEGVGKRFGDRWVLHDVSLHVPAGQVAVLVGHNGAGKTTLLRLLATAVTLDRGRATVAGADVVADPGAVRRAIGLVLGDDRSHFWRLSGAENLRFFATLAGCRGALRQRAVADALAAVGLAEVADRRVDRYSSGMRGRLAVARALVGRPMVILADEPTRSLDQGSARQVRLALAAAAADGATVVLVSHDAADMAGADQVVVLSEGTVVERLGPRPDRATVAAALERWAGAGG